MILMSNSSLSLSRAEMLLYRVNEAIYATDSTGKITLFNHALELLLGIRSSDAIGKNISTLLYLQDEHKNPFDVLSLCSDNLENIRIPEILILRDFLGDVRYLRIKVSVIKGTNTNEYLVTMSDVTKEKELDKAKDEFISIVSHELKTPMSIVKSYLWMLEQEKGGPLTQKQKEYLSKALLGTERMIFLINDILSLSKIEQGRITFNITDFKLSPFIQEVTSEIKVKIEENNLTFNLVWEEDTKDVNVYTDKDKLREILLNLVSNAIKYTKQGNITLKIKKEQNNFVKILITDTGKGIDPKELKKLFHKFQRLDNSYQTVAESGGTGLGLYIVKLYIGLLGGSVGAESKGINKGSTFWVTIPTNKTQLKKVN